MTAATVFFLARSAVVCLSTSLGLYAWKYRYLPEPVRRLGWYLGLTLVTELLVIWMFARNIRNNLPALHIYTLLEFVCWSGVYRAFFHDKQQWRRWFWPWVVSISTVLIINSLFFEPLSGFNSHAKALVHAILVGYAVYYFFDAFGKTDFSRPVHLGFSLINFAVILYYSGSLFIFTFSKLLQSQGASTSTQMGFWVLNALLNVVFQVLILISIWKAASRPMKS